VNWAAFIVFEDMIRREQGGNHSAPQQTADPEHDGFAKPPRAVAELLAHAPDDRNDDRNDDRAPLATLG
jgi:hypothetical protein